MRTTSVDVQSLMSAIDRQEIRLPEIQRAFVWKPAQAAGLIDSLYRGYPSGSLLLWETDIVVIEKKIASLGANVDPMVRPQYLLDGQQRLTSLHRVFTGDPRARVVFNVETARFQIESAATKRDPRWVAVHDLLNSEEKIFDIEDQLVERLPGLAKHLIRSRLEGIRKIADYRYYIEIVEQLPYDEVTEIFVRVNSRGRALKTTDLALATLSARWPGVIARLEGQQDVAHKLGYRNIDLAFLVRALAANATTTATLSGIATTSEAALEEGWQRTQRGLDHLIRLLKHEHLDSSDLIPSMNALIPLVVYLGERQELPMTAEERNTLMYWLLGAFVLSRFSSSAETTIAQDVIAIRTKEGLTALLGNLGLLGQRLVVTTEALMGRGAGSAYFLLSFLSARSAGATDWWFGIDIGTDEHGAFALEYHHIHPQRRLRDLYTKAEINDLANLAFISSRANKKISDRKPSEYFVDLGDDELRAQFVPLEKSLREPENYPNFVKARRELLAQSMTELLDSYRPAFLNRATAAMAAVTPARLAIALSGEESDPDAQVLTMEVQLNEQVWRVNTPFWEMERFLRDVEQGLATQIELGGEMVTLEPGTELIEISLGPLLVAGSLGDWRKVLLREQADLQQAAQAADQLPAWDQDRLAISILDSE